MQTSFRLNAKLFAAQRLSASAAWHASYFPHVIPPSQTSQLDMRKRFRGNIVGSQYTYQADPEEKEREAKLLAEAMAKHSKPSESASSS